MGVIRATLYVRLANLAEGPNIVCVKQTDKTIVRNLFPFHYQYDHGNIRRYV